MRKHSVTFISDLGAPFILSCRIDRRERSGGLTQDQRARRRAKPVRMFTNENPLPLPMNRSGIRADRDHLASMAEQSFPMRTNKHASAFFPDKFTRATHGLFIFFLHISPIGSSR
jgi:hypothetical protein